MARNILPLMLLLLACVLPERQASGGETMSTHNRSALYDAGDLKRCRVNPDVLPDIYREFYRVALPLLYAVDHYLVEQTPYGLPDQVPPECFIPPMRHNDNPVPGDERIVFSREINYENGQWHVIDSERGEETDRHSFSRIEDLVYYILSHFIDVRAYYIITERPELRRRVTEIIRIKGEESRVLDPSKTSTIAGKIGLSIMQAVKSEWTERYRQDAIADLKRYVNHTPEQVAELEAFDPHRDKEWLHPDSNLNPEME